MVVLALVAVRVAEAADNKLMLIETSFNHKDSVVCCASKPGQLKRRVVYLRPEEFKQTLLSVSQM